MFSVPSQHDHRCFFQNARCGSLVERLIYARAPVLRRADRPRHSTRTTWPCSALNGKIHVSDVVLQIVEKACFPCSQHHFVVTHVPANLDLGIVIMPSEKLSCKSRNGNSNFAGMHDCLMLRNPESRPQPDVATNLSLELCEELSRATPPSEPLYLSKRSSPSSCHGR
jgi:hypothetical protein